MTSPRGEVLRRPHRPADRLARDENAAGSVAAWTASHGKQVEPYQGGDYPAALAQAIGPDPSASAAQFAAVETSLRDEIEQTRTTLRDGCPRRVPGWRGVQPAHWC